MWLAFLIAGAIGLSWAFLPFNSALMFTILGIILGGISLFLGWRMDKEVKEGFKRLEKITEDGGKRLQRIIAEGRGETREFFKETARILAKMDERSEEGRKETRELFREIARILEKMEERAEGRHRELIR